MLPLILANLAVCVGTTLQGALGLGLGLIASPTLVLLDPRWVPGPLLTVGLAVTLMLSARERSGLDVRGIFWAILGRFPGTVLGAAAIVIVSPKTMSMVFGAIILLAVALASAGPRLERSRRALLGAGFLSGFMGTTVSVGGPPMALLYQHDEGHRIRATMAGYFLVGILLSLVALAVAGRYGSGEITRAGGLLPGACLGVALSSPLRTILDQGWTRRAVLWVSGVTGVAVVARGIVSVG